MILMGIALAAAECWHYYALFGFVPFAAAEFAEFLAVRRLRWSVWLAIAFGFLPLILSWRLLAGLKEFYGTTVWDKPSIFATANAYSLLLKAFPPIAIAIAVVLSLVALQEFASTLHGRGANSPYAGHEPWLPIGFLALPVIAFIATKLSHGAFTERYVLPTVLGVPLGGLYLLRRVGRRGFALIATFVFTAVLLQEGVFWKSEIHGLGYLDSPAAPIERLVNSAGHADIPAVVSSGHDYFQLAHYAPEETRFVALADPPQAVIYAGSDSLDKILLAMRCCVAVQVYEFSEFAAEHPRFLLYSGGDEWDWWPARLVKDGYSLELVTAEQDRKVYFVSSNTSR